MKIGIVRKDDVLEQQKLLSICDELMVLDEANLTSGLFLKLMKKNSHHVLTAMSLETIGLKLVQLLPSLEYLAENKQIIVFIHRDSRGELSERDYFFELLHLARFEKKMCKKQTDMQIQKAIDSGLIVGRPSIKQEKVANIQSLYQDEKKSFREIAAICEVSVGTAYKYAVQAVKVSVE